MRTMRGVTALIVVVVLVGGCATPELTRRYESAEWVDLQDGEPKVEISVFVLDPPGSKSQPTLLSLSERGQKQLIQELSGKSENSEDLMGSLGGNIGASKPPGDFEDKSNFSKRIVLSVSHAGASRYEPQNRIHALSCDVILKQANSRFISWDRFSTEYGTVDLGKVELDKSVSAELTASDAAPSGDGRQGSTGATLSASRTIGEEISLSQRYVKLSGILRKDRATLIQEGIVGIDLVGNSTVDVTVSVDKRSPVVVAVFNSLKKNDAWSEQKDVALALKYIEYPNLRKPLIGSASCEYVVRVVDRNSGGRTIMEGDDVVTYFTGRAKKVDCFEIVGQREIEPPTWFIRHFDGRVLNVSLGDQTGDVQFGVYSKAVEFLSWLKQKGQQQEGEVSVANRKLLLSTDIMTSSNIDQLVVDVRGNRVSPTGC